MEPDGQGPVASMYHDGRYVELHPEWHGERAAWKAAHVVRALDHLALRPRSICDIGCGTGQVLDHVVGAVPSISTAVGFEPSADVPRPPLESPIGEIRQEDANASDAVFDVALMMDVFEHVEDYLGFLRSCGRLAPHLVLHIPLEITLVSVARNTLGSTRATVGHLHQFTVRTALETLEQCGLRPIHRFLTPAAWTGPGKNPNSPVNMARRAGIRVSESLTQRTLGGMSMLVVTETSTS